MRNFLFRTVALGAAIVVVYFLYIRPDYSWQESVKNELKNEGWNYITAWSAVYPEKPWSWIISIDNHLFFMKPEIRTNPYNEKIVEVLTVGKNDNFEKWLLFCDCSAKLVYKLVVDDDMFEKMSHMKREDYFYPSVAPAIQIFESACGFDPSQ